MSKTEEATINPDGSTTFGSGEQESSFFSSGGAEDNSTTTAEEIIQEIARTDPAIYLMVGFVILAIVYYIYHLRSKKQELESESFFSELDGDKFNLKLPAAVDEYYSIKAKCEEAGWVPGQPPAAATKSGPHRVLAQALMKRCIEDIPIVTYIQKESAGMNKLYSQSMCSVKQWKAYQAAEAMVSAEVDEVRAEADEIEPGWSQQIWRQAMHYHTMLKQRNEAEAKKAAEEANQKKAQEAQKVAKLSAEEEAKAKELAAERAAEELIKQEEREKQSKKAFSNGGMKKGFLAPGGKKK